MALLNRRTPSAAIRAPEGWALKTTVLPAASMLIALPARVGRLWVTGVMAPIDAERGVVGQGQAAVARDVVGAEVLDARDHAGSRRGACRSCGRAGRSWSPRARAARAPRPGRRRSCGCSRPPSCGPRAAGCGTRGRPRRPPRRRRRPWRSIPGCPMPARALPLPSEAPLPIWDSTSWTTLRMRSSVICMADTVALMSLIVVRCCEAWRHHVSGPPHRFVWIIRSERPIPVTCSTRREDHPAADVHGVDQADHHRVDRQFLGLGRQPGARALADQDHLVDARAQRVDHDERAAGRHEPVALLVVDPVGLDRQELVPRHRGDLLGRHHAARHPGQEHRADTLIPWLILVRLRQAVPACCSRIPWTAGRRRSPRWSARSRPATREPAVETLRSTGPDSLSAGSSSIPNQPRSRQTPGADPRRVLADPAGEDDGVGAAQLDEIGAQVVADRADELVDGQLRPIAAGRRRGLDVAEVAPPRTSLRGPIDWPGSPGSPRGSCRSRGG